MPASFVLCFAVIVSGGIFLSRYQPDHPIEIHLEASPNFSGLIYVGGAVVNPGIYPFSSADNIETLVRSAGGLTPGANVSSVVLNFSAGGIDGPQKIDINRADQWLLEALPGIGPTLAQRIVEYRVLNGKFHNTAELQNVTGMGTKTYQQIADLITVVE